MRAAETWLYLNMYSIVFCLVLVLEHPKATSTPVSVPPADSRASNGGGEGDTLMAAETFGKS